MKKALLFTYLFLPCSLTLFAQTEQSPRIVHVKEKSAIHVPPQEAPAGLTKIYSNLGSSKTDLYTISAAGSFGDHTPAPVAPFSSQSHLRRNPTLMFHRRRLLCSTLAERTR